MSELVQAVAVIAAVVGAAFSVWWNTEDKVPVDRNTLVKSLVLSGFTALGLVNLASLPDTIDGTSFTWVGIIISQLFVGAGISKGINHK